MGGRFLSQGSWRPCDTNLKRISNFNIYMCLRYN